MLSFDSVESDCNCEGPVVDYCCPVGFNGSCCEYPLARSAKNGGHLSPLEKKLKGLVPPPRKQKQLKQLEERQPPPSTVPPRPPVVPNITITPPED